MNDVVKSLGPAFAAGFAVQQLLEILDQVISPFFDARGTGYANYKKAILSILALVIGLIVSYWAGLRMLDALGLTGVSQTADHAVTGVFISAGTAGFNSVMKFLNYAKEQKKTDAGGATDTVTAAVAAPAATALKGIRTPLSRT